jgi:hypothetical protein
VANSPGPGYCSYCYGWLGFLERKKKKNAQHLNPYQEWVANQGELIAAAPTMASDPPPKANYRFYTGLYRENQQWQYH